MYKSSSKIKQIAAMTPEKLAMLTVKLQNTVKELELQNVRLQAGVTLALGRLRGSAESNPHDTEAKWAASVVDEVESIINGSTE
jgi:hypothetical protein